MFEWIKERKLQSLVDRARVFLALNYEVPAADIEVPDTTGQQSSGAKHSDRDTGSQAPKVQYQKLDIGERPKYSSRDNEQQSDDVQHQKWGFEETPKYSMRDNYDSDTVKLMLKNMSYSAPTSRMIRDLNANTNMTFVDKLLDHISKRHMRDSDVYKAAQIDRRLFSKIVSDRTYKPAKDTCIAFAFALKLTLSEAEDLLSRAGFTLSHSSIRDVLIEFFFNEHMYDLTQINEVLYRFDQKVIGR